MKPNGSKQVPMSLGALCDQCPLKESIYVPTKIPAYYEIIVVGEAPGATEVVRKEPFTGTSGELLDGLVDLHGHNCSFMVKTNIVACRPPKNREPTPKEVACCTPRLLNEIKEMKVPVLALGKTAREFFEAHPRPNVTYAWHPAYVLRKPTKVTDLIRGIRSAFEGPPKLPFTGVPEVVVAHSVERLAELLQRCPANAVCAYDLETDNVVWYDRPTEPADPVLMLQICWSNDFGVVVPDDVLYDMPSAPVLREFFARKDITFVTHNGKFDQKFLAAHFGIRAPNHFDTMLAQSLLDENVSKGLKSIALREFGVEDYEKDLVQKHLKSRNDRYSKVPFDDLAKYGVWDVVITRLVSILFKKRLIQNGQYEMPFKAVLMRASEAFVDIELRGVNIDTDHLKAWDAAFAEELERVRREAELMTGVKDLNLNSPAQVAAVLYDNYKLPLPIVKRRPTRSTAHAAVSQLLGKHPFVALLMYARRVAKLRSSYIKNLLDHVDANGVAHPEFYVDGTEVGRLAARNPAIQTIPRPGGGRDAMDSVFVDGGIIRGAIIPFEGELLIDADYSQAELRTAAVLAEEPFLLDVYKHGRDLHSEVAAEMYGKDFTKEQRVQCKMFNFSFLYGGNEHSFAVDAGLPINVARAFVRKYVKVMPRLASYRLSQYEYLLEHGYVETLFGRRRHFPLVTNTNVRDARKAVVHMPIAGTASDVTLLAALQLHDEGYKVLFLVHDSVIISHTASEAEEVSQHVQEVMEEVASRYLPEVPWKADADIKERWATPPQLEPGHRSNQAQKGEGG